MAKHLADKGVSQKEKNERRDILIPKREPKRKSAHAAEENFDAFESAMLNKTLDRKFSALDLILAVLSLILLVAAWFLPTSGLVRLLTFLIPFLLAGYSYLFEAFQEAFMGIVLGRELILTAAGLMALCAGSYFGGAAIMVFAKLSDLALSYAEHLQDEKLGTLYALRAESANIEKPAGAEQVRARELEKDDVVLVYPDEVVPVDGTVVGGTSVLDMSRLAGESRSIPVSVGSAAISGAVNVNSPLRIRAERTQNDSVCSLLIRAAENAWMHKSSQERITQRVLGYASPILVIAAVLLALVPSIITGDWRTWLARAAVVLTVSQAYSVVQSVKLCYDCAAAAAATLGTVFKGHDVIEALSKAETFVFDKTGTITRGEYVIKEIYPQGVSEEQLLYIAGAAELGSKHPIARAIVTASGLSSSAVRSVEIEEIPGRGISAFIDDRSVYVGNAAFMEEHDVAYTVPSVTGSAIHVAVNGRYVGHIIVEDALRDGAFDAIEELRVAGVKTNVLLTGDVHSSARKIASSLNFDMVKAELTPEAKVSAVEYLMSTRNANTTLAFIGDGLCDTDALRRATVGVSMDAIKGVEAVEYADTAILGSDIKMLPRAYRIAKSASRAAVVNTVAAGAAKLLVLLFAVSGVFGVGVSVILQAAAVAFTAADAIRVLYFDKNILPERKRKK